MNELSQSILREIHERLERREPLDPAWRDALFPPEKREVELQYDGKKRREDVLSETLAVPLQRVRTFGEPHDFDGDGWHNRLIWGDNLQAMRTLLDLKEAGKLKNADGSDGVRLIYIDPPFATKQEFRGNQDQKAYADKIAGADFIEKLRRRLLLMHELLADDGLLLLHVDYRFGHYLKVVLDEIFPGGFRNDIKVRRGTKNVQNQFEDIRALTTGDDSVYLYAKRSSARLPHLRNRLDEVQPGKWDTFWRGTDRKTMRYPLLGHNPTTGQWRWKKSRAFEAVDNYKQFMAREEQTETLDEYYLKNLEFGEDLDFVRLSDEKVVQYYVPPQDAQVANTLWTQVRTIGKVTSYPTEKHEELLDRIIDWLSKPGDLVLDAFVGSGTTCAVAEKLGRRWIELMPGNWRFTRRRSGF